MEIIVILVNPTDPLNIGMVARAMKNLGVTTLRLVFEKDSNVDMSKTWVTAKGGEDIVKLAKIYQTLQEAIFDCNEVAGFSARCGKNRMEPQWLPQWVSEIKLSSNYNNLKTALVFGTEDNGLSLEHVAICNHLVKIPVFSDYHSYNLAQAVIIALYEINREKEISKDKFYEQNLNISYNNTDDEDLAQPTFSEYIVLDSLVDSILESVDFYNKATPSHIPHLIKDMLRRIKPNKREMSVLLGMFAKIKKNR